MNFRSAFARAKVSGENVAHGRASRGTALGSFAAGVAGVVEAQPVSPRNTWRRQALVESRMALSTRLRASARLGCGASFRPGEHTAADARAVGPVDGLLVDDEHRRLHRAFDLLAFRG